MKILIFASCFPIFDFVSLDQRNFSVLHASADFRSCRPCDLFLPQSPDPNLSFSSLCSFPGLGESAFVPRTQAR
jgi:hypothetical protein